MNTFKEKLNKLPKEVQDYLISMKAAKKIWWLKYLNYLILVKRNLRRWLLILLVLDCLYIATYIKSLGKNSDDYVKYISEQEKAIKEEKKYFKRELAVEKPFEIKIKKQIPVKHRTLNKEKEKKDNLEIFSSSVRYFLQAHYDEYLNTYNKLLILLLFEDRSFKKELEKILYYNTELLTHASFKDGKKPISPTIGNWIQDFIKVYGTAYANNLAIIKYITESKNAKRLNPEEKKIVQKLLQLYRNLKFFPDAFSDLPPERWEIIPSSEDNVDAIKSEKKLTFPKTKAEKEIDNLINEEEKYKKGGLERMAIEEEIDLKKKIDDLQIEINKYKENSLERRALEDELNKLKRE